MKTTMTTNLTVFENHVNEVINKIYDEMIEVTDANYVDIFEENVEIDKMFNLLRKPEIMENEDYEHEDFISDYEDEDISSEEVEKKWCEYWNDELCYAVDEMHDSIIDYCGSQYVRDIEWGNWNPDEDDEEYED